MCLRCDKLVSDMDILESDLPGMPYKMVKWSCLVPGCKCMNIRLRDYGIAPIYWWPVKIVRKEGNKWRGGWVDISLHWRLCWKHWEEVLRMKGVKEDEWNWLKSLGVVDSDEYRLSLVKPYDKVLKSKRWN